MRADSSEGPIQSLSEWVTTVSVPTNGLTALANQGRLTIGPNQSYGMMSGWVLLTPKPKAPPALGFVETKNWPTPLCPSMKTRRRLYGSPGATSTFLADT